LLRSLQQKKFRQKYEFFIAEGPKICAEALSSGSLEIVEIFALPSWLDSNTVLVQNYRSIVTVVSEKELKKISTLKTPNLVLILAKLPDLTVNHSLITKGTHLFCDGIQDPGNLGTIIRISDWFGVSSIMLNEGCVDPYNPKTIQATMGSFMRVPLSIVKDSHEKVFSSFDHIYGAAMEGEDLYESHLEETALFVIGNESKGISGKVRDRCSQLISIPKSKTAGAESLNAAVATGIILGELHRQKM